jgi:cytochrome c biogenesis factor
MKKIMVTAIALFLLTGGVAFAGKAKTKKAEKPKTVECQVGEKKMMAASNLECTNMGGMVLNFPAPAPEMTKAVKAKAKAKKAAPKEMKKD